MRFKQMLYLCQKRISINKDAYSFKFPCHRWSIYSLIYLSLYVVIVVWLLGLASTHWRDCIVHMCVYLFAAIYCKLKMSSYIYKYFEVSQIVCSLIIIHFDIILTNHCWEGQIHWPALFGHRTGPGEALQPLRPWLDQCFRTLATVNHQASPQNCIRPALQ